MNSQNSIVAERAYYLEAGLGEASVLIETHLFLYLFLGGRHCLVLTECSGIEESFPDLPDEAGSRLSCLFSEQTWPAEITAPLPHRRIPPLSRLGWVCCEEQRPALSSPHPWHTASDRSDYARCLVKRGETTGMFNLLTQDVNSVCLMK